MKGIIGIDGMGDYKPALNMYARLRFEPEETMLVHAVDTTMPFSSFELIPSGTQVPSYLAEIKKAGRAMLDNALVEAKALGLNVSDRLLIGPAAACLTDEADAYEADLIAVRSLRKGAFGSMFFGSTSRSLAIGARHSILVVKPEVQKGEGLTAVLATDHSAYADKCIEKFLSMGCRGISKIHLITAYSVDDYEATVLKANLPMIGDQVDKWIDEQLTRRSEEVVAKLRAAGYEADCLVEPGHPNDVIRVAMEAKKADLLLIGAQGHGFIDRLLIGSISLHQVVAEPYSVMVLRA